MTTITTVDARAPRGASASPEWARKYPPLIALLAAVIIAIAILPSALNIPQTNPSQTLEYAPVPPKDEEPPPPAGNFSSFSLGESASLETGGAEGAGPGGSLPGDIGKGGNPQNKKCVGSPPRQTEDPLAPPCVGNFKGDNFGATYQGVTAEEVRFLVYLQGGITYISAAGGPEGTPTSKYYDLGKPPDPAEREHLMVRGLRIWQRYFNDRFQTYNRRVHFYVYWSGSSTPEARRADAADNYNRIKPFAVLTEAIHGGHEDVYLESMARRGVLNFGAFGLRPQSFFQRFAKKVWGYQPSIEQQVDQYASYVCTKAVPNPVSMSGNPTDQGKRRKFGLLHTTSNSWPGLVLAARLVKQRVEGCGGDVDGEATFQACCLGQDNGENPDYAVEQMADFKRRGVTTILWTGGINGQMAKAAAGIGYYPEWILMGDSIMDAHHPIRLSYSSATFDKHAIVVSPEVLEPSLEQQRCYQTIREADPHFERPNIYYLCPMYKHLFQFFVGVQVAGPRLGPTSIDRGYHAIPSIESTNPQVPACFYYPGDYTCVKDAEAMWWDAASNAPGESAPGCWRALHGGRRSLPGKWPPGNINAGLNAASDPCNGYNSAVVFSPA